MDIDLLEDAITVSFLREYKFTLFELYDIKAKLSNLESIKKDMIKHHNGFCLRTTLLSHQKHLNTITDNMVSVTKMIDIHENSTVQSLGSFGDLSLN